MLLEWLRCFQLLEIPRASEGRLYMQIPLDGCTRRALRSESSVCREVRERPWPAGRGLPRLQHRAVYVGFFTLMDARVALCCSVLRSPGGGRCEQCVNAWERLRRGPGCGGHLCAFSQAAVTMCSSLQREPQQCWAGPCFNLGSGEAEESFFVSCVHVIFESRLKFTVFCFRNLLCKKW